MLIGTIELTLVWAALFGKNRVLVSHGNSDSVGAVGTTGLDKSMRNSHISRLGTDKAKTGAGKQDLQH